MPTYLYECKGCGHRFEIFQRLSDKPVKSCPKCGMDKATRRLTPPQFILKGTGFYATEYKTGGVQKESKKETKKEDLSGGKK